MQPEFAKSICIAIHSANKSISKVNSKMERSAHYRERTLVPTQPHNHRPV